MPPADAVPTHCAELKDGELASSPLEYANYCTTEMSCAAKEVVKYLLYAEHRWSEWEGLKDDLIKHSPC